MPISLNAQNTEISFLLDTTWHTVHGKIKTIQGEASLRDPKDFKSVTINASFSVSDFDTDNEDRDEEMRACMQSDRFPLVSFELTTAENLCNPSSVTPETPCSFMGKGSITIRDVTKAIDLPAQVKVQDDQTYIVEGDTTIEWPDFGVEDPSILIAKVHSKVSIHFSLTLSNQKV